MVLVKMIEKEFLSTVRIRTLPSLKNLLLLTMLYFYLIGQYDKETKEVVNFIKCIKNHYKYKKSFYDGLIVSWDPRYYKKHEIDNWPVTYRYSLNKRGLEHAKYIWTHAEKYGIVEYRNNLINSLVRKNIIDEILITPYIHDIDFRAYPNFEGLYP